MLSSALWIPSTFQTGWILRIHLNQKIYQRALVFARRQKFSKNISNSKVPKFWIFFSLTIEALLWWLLTDHSNKRWSAIKLENHSDSTQKLTLSFLVPFRNSQSRVSCLFAIHYSVLAIHINWPNLTPIWPHPRKSSSVQNQERSSTKTSQISRDQFSVCK